MFDIFEMLRSATNNWTTPGVIMLPTLGFVIGSIFFQISIWFDKHERYLRASQLSREQLLQTILSLNLQRLWLALLVVMLSGFSFYGCYLLSQRIKVFTARSRRKNLVEQTLLFGLPLFGILIILCVDLEHTMGKISYEIKK